MLQVPTGGALSTCYMFVDGAYLDPILKDIGQRFFDEDLELDYAKFATVCRKVYYYDCLPPKRTNETEEQHALNVLEKKKRFAQLRALDGWHVSEGVSKHTRQRGAVQKEIDILIAVDMMMHTYRKNMDELIFVAGDQDFRPLVEALVNEGMYVSLWYDQRHAAESLIHTADTKFPLDIFNLYDSCTNEFKDRHPMPRIGRHLGMGSGANIVETGKRDGVEVAWLERYDNNRRERLWTSDTCETSIRVALSELDAAMLKRMHSNLYGPCIWSLTTPSL